METQHTIRPARQEDASRLAEILIFAKRMAYRPIFRNDYVSFNVMQVLPLALHYRDEADALRDVFVYDENGDEVNHYQNIDVPLYRNRETVLRGPFLTQNVGSGDIGIDDGFDDEFVVVIPD